MLQLAECVPARDWDGRTARALETADREVFHQGNFTIVVFHSERGLVAGVAKRNPTDDPDDPERGEKIATVRAYRQFQQQGWS